MLRLTVLLFAIFILFATASALAEEEENRQASQEAAEKQESSDALVEDGIIIEGLDDIGAGDESGADEPMEATSEKKEKLAQVNFKGRLLERGTRKPIANLSIYLKGTDFSSMSDGEGFFTFSDLPPAEYDVVIPSTDYETYETKETINPNELTEVVYYVDPKIYGTLEVVVHGRKEKKEVSKKVLRKQEIEVIPGTLGDPVKVVQNLPGVAKGGTGGDAAAGVVMRGSNAEDSRVLLDGHQIPMLYHFGGLKSVYNAELLNNVSLIAGGFGTEYGNATGGIVELESRKPRSDRWGGYIDTSFIDLSGIAEGPINDDMTLAVGFRRSTIDFLLPLVMSEIEDISFSTYPAYYDYQLKWDWEIDDHHNVRFDAYGAVDMMKLTTETVADNEPEFSGTIGFDTMFFSFVPTYEYKDDVIESKLSPMYSFIRSNFRIGDDFYLKTDAHLIDINEDVRVHFTKDNTFGFGVQLQPRMMDLEANMVRPPKEGDVSISFSNEETVTTTVAETDIIAGVYMNDEINIGNFTLIPGIRFDYESYLNRYAIDPRATARWNVIEPFTLKAAGGLYSRVPDPDEMAPPFGNKGIEFERAVHAVGGFEWDIVNGLFLDIQGYYKYQFDLINAISKTDEENASDKVYNNKAKGYVFGGEVFLKYRYQDIFFGWVSYSIAKAMRNDGPGTQYRPFDYDQRHNLVVVASWQFYKGWRLGGRFQFTSGEPYTEIDGGVFNADNGTYLPMYNDGKKNAKRGAPYHRLDIRLDKKWVFNTWMLHTYLDIQGVYYHANEVNKIYNYDFSEETAFRDLPILPSIGLKAEF